MAKSQETRMNLKCPTCGGELKNGLIKEEKWIEGKLLVIDNLTARICNTCGESLVDYATMQKIEQMIENFRLKKITGTKFTAYEIDAASARTETNPDELTPTKVRPLEEKSNDRTRITRMTRMLTDP